jgi:hypothetical protein
VSGRATQAKGREPAQSGLDVDNERQHEEPGARRLGRWPLRDVTVKYIELQDTGMMVRNSGFSKEDRVYAAAGRLEQIWPVTLNLPVKQQVQAEPVPIEAQAGLEVTDHDYGMMNASRHRTRR